MVGGERVAMNIKSIWERPFCRLLHFERALDHAPKRPQPKLLLVAPMSGHYPTLLRGTVQAFLPNHDVYITEWIDARMVPVSEGRFDLEDRKSTRLNSSHSQISYAVFCLKKKTKMCMLVETLRRRF